MPLEGEVDDRVQQGVSGTDKGGKRLSLGSHERFFKSDALVSGQNGLADSDQAVPVSYRGKDMGNLITAGLPLFGNPSQALEGFKEKGFDFDKRKIELTDPIKELGVYQVNVKLHSDVNVKVKLWVIKN